MVKRYSHIARIAVAAEGKLVNGEWVEGASSTEDVKGQYYSSNTGNQVRTNIDGNEFVVKGEFSTKHRKIAGAIRIEIESIGLCTKIQAWEQYQTHSVIYV